VDEEDSMADNNYDIRGPANEAFITITNEESRWQEMVDFHCNIAPFHAHWALQLGKGVVTQQNIST
jgi:hypothetical protein